MTFNLRRPWNGSQDNCARVVALLIRQFFRGLRTTGQRSDVWPVILLLLAVLVPAACLIWFMTAAMRNERFAARQQFADLYRAQLLLMQSRLEQEWTQKLREFEIHADLPPPAAFLKCIHSGFIDAAVILDAEGGVAYPNGPGRAPSAPVALPALWLEAVRQEYVENNPVLAAASYAAAAANTTDVHAAARARQAQARCLRRAGRNDAATRLINEMLADPCFDNALDGEGRLIVANAELMALEMAAPGSDAFKLVAASLQRRVMDYENAAMMGSQRLFLMKELKRLEPGINLPALAAEELVSQWREKGGLALHEPGLRRTPVSNLWQFTTPDRRVVALVRTGKLMLADDANIPNAKVALLPPDIERDAFISVPAGAPFPGWRLTLSIKDPGQFAVATRHRAAIYLWTIILVGAVIAVLTFLAVRLMRRQAAIARLKSDLAATVSHELKTPLSSMRMLVDTLLDSQKFDERQVREYLRLVAGENERLSRLVQNFLTFSRMERSKHTFHFELVSPRQIVDGAISAAAERLGAPGCRLNLQVDAGLPDLMADGDALTTALVNLLDNACKYSEDIKQIDLRARVESANVVFSVQDNGIGIARRELKRVFRDFYQVDRGLSRERGGCGLGLSIVKFIVDAHAGAVSAESEAGRGSTFTITIPAIQGCIRGEKATA